MRIFLDDERAPEGVFWLDCSGEWTIVRSFKEFRDVIHEHGLPEFISFDHDLGELRTGMDCAWFLVDYCMDNELAPTFEFQVHSMNPVGARNIMAMLTHFKELN